MFLALRGFRAIKDKLLRVFQVFVSKKSAPTLLSYIHLLKLLKLCFRPGDRLPVLYVTPERINIWSIMLGIPLVTGLYTWSWVIYICLQYLRNHRNTNTNIISIRHISVTADTVRASCPTRAERGRQRCHLFTSATAEKRAPFRYRTCTCPVSNTVRADQMD